MNPILLYNNLLTNLNVLSICYCYSLYYPYESIYQILNKKERFYVERELDRYDMCIIYYARVIIKCRDRWKFTNSKMLFI